jgi:anti-sigma regulatory factor (Ser/Thr protein kinase)
VYAAAGAATIALGLGTTIEISRISHFAWFHGGAVGKDTRVNARVVRDREGSSKGHAMHHQPSEDGRPGAWRAAVGRGEVALLLPFDPEIGGAARRLVQEHMPPTVVDDALFDLELLATELATNAYRHGGPPVRLRLVVEPDRVRVEVHDGSRELPRAAEPSSEGGWGILLIASVSDRWGCELTGQGKIVWGERPMTPDWNEQVAAARFDADPRRAFGAAVGEPGAEAPPEGRNG